MHFLFLSRIQNTIFSAHHRFFESINPALGFRLVVFPHRAHSGAFRNISKWVSFASLTESADRLPLFFAINVMMRDATLCTPSKGKSR